MTYTVQELALRYAEKLVEFHEANQSNWSNKEKWARLARNDMYAAQHALDQACQRQAELNAQES
jgi:hypothetical protein